MRFPKCIGIPWPMLANLSSAASTRKPGSVWEESLEGGRPRWLEQVSLGHKVENNWWWSKDPLHSNDLITVKSPPCGHRDLGTWNHKRLPKSLDQGGKLLTCRHKSVVDIFSLLFYVELFQAKTLQFGQPALMGQDKKTFLCADSILCYVILSFIFLLWSLQR